MRPPLDKNCPMGATISRIDNHIDTVQALLVRQATAQTITTEAVKQGQTLIPVHAPGRFDIGEMINIKHSDGTATHRCTVLHSDDTGIVIHPETDRVFCPGTVIDIDDNDIDNCE